MSAQDKIHNAADELHGKAKEAVGKVTSDEELEAQGRDDQTKAKIKRVGEDIKDVFDR